MAAGLLAKKAVELGLKPQPWVKASLAPGSKVVSDYLAKAKLTPYLDELGFNLVGYGCTTCIGNSGPLPEPIEAAIKQGDLTVGAVLSGNRNFEGRIHPLVKTNWLASPPLVVAYALAGNMTLLKKGAAADRNSARISIMMGRVFMAKGEFAKAVENLLRVIDQDKELVSETLEMLQTCYQQLDKQDEWVTFLRRCVEENTGATAELMLSDVVEQHGLVDVLFEPGQGYVSVRTFIDTLLPKLNGVRAMLRARTRVLQLPRSELMDITEDWVDAAFCLEPKDIAYMERLVMLQNRHHAQHHARRGKERHLSAGDGLER